MIKNNVVTVYSDGSYQNINNGYYIGMSLFIIHPDFSDIKIAKAKKVLQPNIHNSSYAEMQALIIFLDYINNEENFYLNKEIYLYSDSEKVVKILNDKIKYLSCLKKKYMNILNKFNIKAFWIKGHLKEKGNFIADSLAYNIIHTLDANIEHNEIIYKNKSLSEIFSPVLRTSQYYSLPPNYFDFNKIVHQRYMDIDNNNIHKSQSSYFQNKIFLSKKEENTWEAIVDGNIKDDIFSIISENENIISNNDFLSLIDVVKNIHDNVNLICEMRKEKTDKTYINIYFNDIEAIEEINRRIAIIKKMKENNQGLEMHSLLKKDRLYRVLTSFFKRNRVFNIFYIEES